jgi:hypothetical protein
MQSMNPLAIVSKGLDSLTLTLGQPPDQRTLKTPDERKEAYIRWAITYYVYSVIAHIRTVLRGLIVLADSVNIPTAMVVCRHVFEVVCSSLLHERQSPKTCRGERLGRSPRSTQPSRHGQ